MPTPPTPPGDTPVAAPDNRLRYHVIKYAANGTISTAGRSTTDPKEAAHRASRLIEIETDETAEIMVVDDIELFVLSLGKRCLSAPE